MLKRWQKQVWIVGVEKSFFRALFFVLCLNAGCAGMTNESRDQLVSDNQTQLVKDLGIEVQSIRLSAEGYMIDFRYKAIDPDKADILFSRQSQPYLLHEATGTVFSVPTAAKVGPLRQTTNRPIAGKSYFMLFGNPGRYVKPGDEVTIILGDYRIEHLTVE